MLTIVHARLGRTLATAAGSLVLCVPVALAQTHLGGPGQLTDLWETKCASCHGETGKGGPAGTLSLLDDELFDQQLDRRFFDSIKNGVAGSAMNGFAQDLDDAKVWALVVHIRELQHKERRERLGTPTPKQFAGDPKHVFTTQKRSFHIRPIAGGTQAGLKTPWAIDFIPKDERIPEALRGSMLITEKPGSVRILRGSDGGLTKPIAGTPPVHTRGQGGMLDVAVHPDYASNGWIYLSYSAFEDMTNSKGEQWKAVATRVVRGKLDVSDPLKPVWVSQETIFEARPDTRVANASYHFGCRIAFDPPVNGKPRQGYVYISIGEHGNMNHAQDLTRHNGKIHRLFDDGRVPDDNPFVAQAKENPKIYASIWSYGHRNPQGLTFDSEGNLWDTEHGMRGGDELNLVKPGANYGWPLVSFGVNYADTPFKTPWPELDDSLKNTPIVMPALRWLPSLAVCGLAGGAELAGQAFPDDQWNQHDLFAGGLAMNTVHRVRVQGGKVIEDEEVLYGLGRVRDVVWGPAKGEGEPRDLYVVLNDPDQIVKLVAAHSEKRESEQR